MKTISIFLFFLVAIVLSSIAQGKLNLGIELGKCGSIYRYFYYYKGEEQLASTFSYQLHKNIHIQTGIDYALSKQSIYTAKLINYNIGILYAPMAEKFYLNFYIGTGFEKILLYKNKEILYNLNSVYTIVGEPAFNYRINKHFRIRFYYKVLYAKLKKNNDFSQLNYLHHTRFGAVGIGINFNF